MTDIEEKEELELTIEEVEEENNELLELTAEEKELKILTSKLELTTDLEEKSHLRTQIKQLEMRDEYRLYADRNSIYYDEDDDDEILISNCNKFHQEQLKQNHFEDEGCGVRGCKGWYVAEHRCECGAYKGFKWDDSDFDPSDINSFDINETVPYGQSVKTWYFNPN